MRELELASTSADDRGVGRLSAGTTALAFTAASVMLLWVVGALPGFLLAAASGVLALIYGLRSRRSAHYTHGRAWWLGTVAVTLTVVSFVACLTLNVLVPDKARGGASCVFTGSCPTTGR
jgi:Na+-driven multidrug efflux pump